MSFADKFTEKTDELKAKAKIALREALDDKNNKDHGTESHTDTTHTYPTRDTHHDRATASTTAPDTAHDPAGAGAPDVADRDAHQPRYTREVPDVADRDAHQPRYTREVPDAERRPDRVPTQPSTATPTAATGYPHTPAEEHQPDSTLDSTQRHDAVDHRAHTAPRDRDVASPSNVANDQRLFSGQRTRDYTERWNNVKGEFVDEPRRAIAEADRLVGDILTELHTLFDEQRRHLEHSLGSTQASTEDLRIALGRYREFFDRLLSL